MSKIATPRSKKILRFTAAATVALAAAAAPVYATIVAVVPDVVRFTPTDVTLDATESDVRIIAFDEEQCETLPPPGLWTDQGFLPGGLKVSSHLLHLDPENPTVVLDGRARFDTRIIGVISASGLLDASDFLGRNTITYPAPGSEPNRGLEAFQPDDRYQVLPGGRVIQVQMDVPSFTDQVRVLTCCKHDPQCD
jgi:hypothetical protein